MPLRCDLEIRAIAIAVFPNHASDARYHSPGCSLRGDITWMGGPGGLELKLLTKTETFGKGLPALGKRMEGPAHEEVGVTKLGKEAHAKWDPSGENHRASGELFHTSS